MSDVVVIGAGIAGLTAAIRARQAGKSVTMIHKGLGGLQLSQGSIDILGYIPDRVTRPLDELAGFATAHEGHPYQKISADAVRKGVEWITETLGPDLLAGSPDENVNLPTAVGAVRPTSVACPSLLNGKCVGGAKFLIAGPGQFKDFYPELVAGNLNRTLLPDGGRIEARAATFDLPGRPGEADSSGLAYARSMDDPAYRSRLVALLKPLVQEGETVGLPAFLGVKDANAWRDVQEELGHPVFEIPLPPPGVIGMRFNQKLIQLAKDLRVRVILGPKVTGFQATDGKVTSVEVASSGHPMQIAGDNFVFAPGGFESGALRVDSYMKVSEPVFGLPLVGADNPDLLHGDYWGPPQPLFLVGVGVDEQMRPVDAAGAAVYSNLFAAGGILAGATRWQEKSGEGIALGSAVIAIDTILGGN